MAKSWQDLDTQRVYYVSSPSLPKRAYNACSRRGAVDLYKKDLGLCADRDMPEFIITEEKNGKSGRTY